MTTEAKVQAVYKIRVSVKALEETYDRLGEEFEKALPSDQKAFAARMGRVLEEKTAEGIFLNHLEAATTDVAPPDPQSYKELDAGLAKLEEMKRTTSAVKKVLQLASAIVDHAANNRVEVSKRTT